jgi:hypothetical protein
MTTTKAINYDAEGQMSFPFIPHSSFRNPQSLSGPAVTYFYLIILTIPGKVNSCRIYK